MSDITHRIAWVNLHYRTNVFIRLPSSSDMIWDRYIAPFSYGLWLAVGITSCALGVCLALTNYGHERNQSLTVSAIFFYIHACFCRQGQCYKSCCFLNPITWIHFFIPVLFKFTIPIFLIVSSCPSLNTFYWPPLILTDSPFILLSSFSLKTKMDSLQCYGQWLSRFGLAAFEVWKDHNAVRFICYSEHQAEICWRWMWKQYNDSTRLEILAASQNSMIMVTEKNHWHNHENCNKANNWLSFILF